jgi:hypothetical protein
LGCIVERRRLQACSERFARDLALPLYGTTTTALKFNHRGLHRNNKDERTVTTACLQPGSQNGLQRPTDLYGQTRAQLIMAGKLISIKGRIHLRRLVSSPLSFPLQSCGGPASRAIRK